ncbi:MAG: hypothetical protein ACYTAS_15980 [Planctomycetota bacterium]|jgi:hypothetical protein
MRRLIVILVLLMAVCSGCSSEPPAPSAAKSTGTRETLARDANETLAATGQPVRYEVLRQWKPHKIADGLGLELLLKGELSEEAIKELLRNLSQGKNPVAINIYTDRETYEDARNGVYGEPFRRHFILTYINPDFPSSQ